MSSKDNLALDLEHGVRRWDRARWISVFSSHNPTIREVTECLGLGLSASSSTTNRGIPKFDNPDYRKLSSEVTKLSKELPKERDALLDFAADPSSLDKELEDLLATYGPAIWGRDADRSCLLSPDPAKKTYNKDLFYEQPDHKEILKVHLHRWIIIKACYYIRNMKLKRPSGANEYDTLADIDGEGGSPHGTPLSRTPHSLTPPERDASTAGEYEVKPINLKKRKSSAHLSMSDGEEHAGSPAKRAYSTMPINVKGSPRKSLKSLYPAGPGSTENIPPLPSHVHRRSPPVPGTESGRVHLSPLASNELNGVSRPPVASQSPAPGGFTAVNNNGFTAVNNSPPARHSDSEPPRDPSREPQHHSPSLHHRDAPNYTSPYEPASRNSAPAQNGPEPRAVTTLKATPVQDSQAGTPVLPSNGANGIVPRGASPAHQSNLTHIAPQPPTQVPQHSPTPTHHQPQIPAQQSAPPLQAAPSLVHVQPQPQHQIPSRTNTPSAHQYGRSLAPHPTSRSSTPLAVIQPHTAPNAQIAPAPAVQSAPAYGIQLVPTQNIPPPSGHAPPAHVAMAPAHPHMPHPSVLKSQPTEVPQPVQAPLVAPRAAIAMADIRLLQYEVTAGLFTFFFPKVHSPPDEHALLSRMNTLWYHGEPLFRPELSTYYDLISKILTAWMNERHAILAFQHSLASQSGVSPAGLVDRLLAMNDLRVMRLKWKNMSTVEGLSPEDLLCMAFRVMTNTEGSEYLFKDGLDRLNGGVFEFLRSEDAKIVMQRR